MFIGKFRYGRRGFAVGRGRSLAERAPLHRWRGVRGPTHDPHTLNNNASPIHYIK
ncbi:hypothetical protein CRG98_023156 [Punica granatum]|uniref:Uncharacterized protein n=1 Tax=Punica granatum TaxID=22663 RepID=A0A2I0JJI3_PUNGR|nr:hypothetical protein CRG98_023156 [Punica granatum]